ncbi:MAG TPA: FAD-dependent oxidoreductase [Pyrinomonadaceae bacterium]|nr:FAD-dependent oxidoreductase [Pyrinomonadaceae bacterium]
MSYEVVVVGAGVGGLTAAALLAARGVKVCLVERGSSAGGCVRAPDRSGHQFEPGAGLYASWQNSGIHERVFAELPVAPPEVREISPSYVVRLPDSTDISVGGSDVEFEARLKEFFPECADAAVSFYRDATLVGDAVCRAARNVPDLPHATRLQRLKLLTAEARAAPRVLAGLKQTAAHYLQDTSPRFRRFVDAQLQIFAQRTSDECAYLYATVALSVARRGMHAIRGGASALAEVLTEAIIKSGGMIRFDTPALRLAYDPRGKAVGVTLLSGETIDASRAVISNLTVWDTYGKLVGLSRTPLPVRARLKELRGWGAYILYLSADEESLERLPAERILALTEWQEGRQIDPEQCLLMFSAAPAWDTRAPVGKRAVTVSTFTDAAAWFAFHKDEEEHEKQDQTTLEAWWERLHAALPELGAGVEVIETATPRTFYEATRRKLGMVGGVGQSLDVFGSNSLTFRTAVPNLFMVGDTTFPGQGVAAITHSALVVANAIAPPSR